MSIRRALAFSFVDRYAGLVISTVSSMVLARLLTPSEIGVYSVVMVLLGFVATFRDLGAGQYLVRHTALTPQVMRATFTVQLALGALFAVVVVLAAEPVARFYAEPRMRDILWVLGLNFLLTPWLAYPSAWLLRELRFGNIAVVRFIGALAHAGVSIGLVLAGFGPVSLAAANLATTIAGIVAIRIAGARGLPMRPTREGLRDVLSFGGSVTAISLLDTLRTGVAELTLGRLVNLGAAGQFSRAQGLVAMFEQLVLNAVNQVALPYFSKEVREGRALGEPLCRALALVTGLGWAFFGGLALLAYPAIRVLYGPQWGEAVDPARWLALAAALALPALTCHSPFIAAGAVAAALRAHVVAAGLMVAAAVGGAHFGLLFTTQLVTGAAALATLHWLWLAHTRLGLDLRALGTAFTRSAVLAGATMAVPAAVVAQWGWRPGNVALALLVAVPGGVAGFALAAWATRHDLWREAERALPALQRWSRRA